MKLPEFSKLAPQFDGKSLDLVDAENWVMRVEKPFSAFEVPEWMKMPLAEFQLNELADDWWKNERANLPKPVGWEGFKVLFYKRFFPQSTKDLMLSQLWALKQGTRTVVEYEVDLTT